MDDNRDMSAPAGDCIAYELEEHLGALAKRWRHVLASTDQPEGTRAERFVVAGRFQDQLNTFVTYVWSMLDQLEHDQMSTSTSLERRRAARWFTAIRREREGLS